LARYHKDTSTDFVMSDSPAVHIGRSRLRDNMFETAADHGPLTSISASPPEGTTSQSRFGHRNSFDCIMDKEQRFSMEDCNWGHVKRKARTVRRCQHWKFVANLRAPSQQIDLFTGALAYSTWIASRIYTGPSPLSRQDTFTRCRMFADATNMWPKNCQM